MSEVIHARKTRQVMCGGVPIGGGAMIPIQSMTNTRTEDVASTLAQIQALEEAGCDIVRCAVPTEEAAAALREIVKASPLPVVADIHFDYRLALAAVDAGAAKIRINPGNIGSKERVKTVVSAAKEKGIPIRIGVNSGSVEKELIERFGGPVPEALAESALRNIAMIEDMGFSDIVLSVKSSDVTANIAAHQMIAARTDVPFRMGITEAGIGEAAIVKSAAGIGALLALGIGDTVRVSLTGNPVNEIAVARDILRATGRLQGAITLISCPTCGRCKVDLALHAARAQEALSALENENIKKRGKNMTIAVMGCAVNGPGEASHADFGLAFGPGKAVCFEHGVQKEVLEEHKALNWLLARARASC